MLKQRIITAILLITGFILAVFFLPAVLWALLVCLIGASAIWEWSRLATIPLSGSLCLGLGVLGPIGLFAAYEDLTAPPEWVLALYALAVLFWLLLMPFWLYRGWKIAGPVRGLLVGWVLILPPSLALIQLRAIGPWLLLSVMAAVWLADIAAFFTGRRFGRRKLAPSISPGKSWEGAYGGGIAVAVYALALYAVCIREAQPVMAVGVMMGALFYTAMSIQGDLFESLAKRQCGMKDSSQLLPGHGGILDRIDSLTATLPFAALAAALPAAFLRFSS